MSVIFQPLNNEVTDFKLNLQADTKKKMVAFQHGMIFNGACNNNEFTLKNEITFGGSVVILIPA
jgi:hypothetical protein